MLSFTNVVNFHPRIGLGPRGIACDDSVLLPVDIGSINSGQTSARWHCEQLERGRILYFEKIPFDLPAEAQRVVLSHQWEATRLHKNISYRPTEDRLRGFSGDRRIRTYVYDLLRDHSAMARKFLERVVSSYAGKWKVNIASFRYLEERGRALPVRKRNDLLHVDAFPTRPTNGARILRLFTNLNRTTPRVWQTSFPFEELARRYAFNAGLRDIAADDSWRGAGIFNRIAGSIGRALGFHHLSRSAYDRFMLRFHNYLKENPVFQVSCAKTRIEFPPLSSWLVFTDGVAHSVVSGRYAIEQTVLIPNDALVCPQHSPRRVLERLCGRSLA